MLRLRDLPGVLAFWLAKKILPADTFKKLVAREKATAFSLATVWDEKLLGELYRSILTAIRGAQTVAEWKVAADKILAGFGGRVYSGETFSAWYADLVFRQNTMTAYAAGRYAEMFNTEWIDRAPYWMYVTARDERVRPEHEALDGKVFAKIDKYARQYLPPWDFNCRCQAIELDAADVAAGGYQVTSGSATGVPPNPGWDVDRVVAIVPPELLTGRAA